MKKTNKACVICGEAGKVATIGHDMSNIYLCDRCRERVKNGEIRLEER